MYMYMYIGIIIHVHVYVLCTYIHIKTSLTVCQMSSRQFMIHVDIKTSAIVFANLIMERKIER